MKNKRIFITGGAGFLGKNLINSLYDENEIICYSRDEAKHYFLKKKFPKIKCIVGDIRDKDRLVRCSKGSEIGIFAASLKQISACDENTSEAVNVIVNGAINSKIAAEDNNFESACFISSDKACSATTIYGACKFVAEQSFIVNQSHVKLTSCRYGNVTNSTGSIIPLIKNAIDNNIELDLYSEEMTRFMLDVNDAINLIFDSIKFFDKKIVIPKIQSFKIKDLFDIYTEFGLKYKVSHPRVGEKIHEIMINQEESNRTSSFNENYFLIDPIKTSGNLKNLINNEYSSKDFCISKENLFLELKKKNFYL